jgi:RNA polymerase sigma factor (sigma-70 family)
MSEDGRTDPRSDAELLRLARRDPAAFRVVYDRHAVRVHGFLLRRTGDAAAAFELTAETFARAWLSRDHFTDRGEGAAPWLFGIARNVLAGSVREQAIQRGARRSVGLDAAEDVAAPSDAWLVGLDEDLAAALDELPEAQRRAVEMRVLDGSNYAEVARELDISPGAARVRVHRGLAALRRALAPDRTAPEVAPPPIARRPGDRR